jgi:quaternary ammonium compound-resistance protein SugE
MASFALLSQALRVLPVGTAYAVWTGIGAVGTAIVGIILLGESANMVRILSILLIAIGILGLKMAPGT